MINFESADGYVEYGEEFIFEAGKLFDDVIMAGGWIELRQDTPDEEPTVSAIFALAQHGDWTKGLILKDELAVQAHYDIETAKWDVFLDTF